ncbi:aminotransferase class V-fold PLP-dependent enzyme [Tepidibacter sp. Z1-5]|uniref:aminotransferase class V-fold PLP-dependent enzyme n=1 Tax=Tepidibacter sp. Z1-5 TaxID=3134138 RepID=UPI0030C0EECC
MINNLSKYIEGANIPVTTTDGKVVKRIYFNNAATTLVLRPVMRKVNANIPLLAYIDAPGPLGKRITMKYEDVRDVVINFVGADASKDTVIYTKNSTDGINLLSDLLYQEAPDQVIVTTDMEHMANYLPFTTRFETAVVGVTKEGDLDLDDLENKLNTYKGRVKLVTVTGASNVTGITPPIYKISKLVHKYGAKILVDAVQLVQHRPFSMKPHSDDEHIDFVVFSAHKCYTPFEGGALIGPYDFFCKYKPYLEGSGITKFISSEKVIYSNPPKRYEAGYPDIFGIIAMGETIKFLENVGVNNIAKYEKMLYRYMKKKLKSIPNVILYGQDSDLINIPYIAFNVKGIYHTDVANYLAYEHGIEVGAGTAGADIYVQSLLGVSPQEAYELYVQEKPAGIVRVSLGMYNSVDEINRFVDALRKL